MGASIRQAVPGQVGHVPAGLGRLGCLLRSLLGSRQGLHTCCTMSLSMRMGFHLHLLLAMVRCPKQVSEAVAGAASEIGRRLSERLATKQDLQGVSVKVRGGVPVTGRAVETAEGESDAVHLQMASEMLRAAPQPVPVLSTVLPVRSLSVAPHLHPALAHLPFCNRSIARCLGRMWSACCGPTRRPWHPRPPRQQPPTPMAQVCD